MSGRLIRSYSLCMYAILNETHQCDGVSSVATHRILPQYPSSIQDSRQCRSYEDVWKEMTTQIYVSTLVILFLSHYNTDNCTHNTSI